ncbi:succinic semialdehyde dehydrogenase [Rubrobacter calidifluminis]|uniref:succinic semialdehyde dehydrogenase n=1 Tax=Rubrobacter calidifluminis TaxID=1392640 RepID=UPI00235F1474|nr:succinic semialdehyde dehydrogenase [Rubrobacter calidifluminis]
MRTGERLIASDGDLQHASGTRSLMASTGRLAPDDFLDLAREATASGEPLDVECPFTGEVFARVSRSTPEDVREAFRRARRAQPGWAALSFRERGEVFLRFHDRLLERREELLDLVQLEAGKARLHVFEELLDAAIVARYYAHTAGRHLKSRRRQGAIPLLTSTVQHRHPVGAVGFIVPWNYPLTLAITDAIPAMMAGNAAVIKPDHKTPLTALWLARLLRGCGLPRDLIQIVPGEGGTVGERLVEEADFVMFTGSTETGRRVAAKAAGRLVGSSMELGGKNPMIVFEDADLDRTVEGAIRACFASAGQLCISAERLYVHAAVYDRFLPRFVDRTRNLRLGAGLDYSSEMGSLVSAAQLERVRSHVEEAVEGGARVLAGGRPRPDLGPYFYEPTILTGVREGMSPFSEETFGPVVSVYRFHTPEEAVSLANATRYGLNASLWTRSTRWAEREIAPRIQAGTVNINEAYAASWASTDSPMGGFKDSGLGRRHGEEGITKYTESQTVTTQRLIPLVAPFAGIEGGAYERLMVFSIRLLRHLPGIK